MPDRHPVNQRHHGDGRTFGERLADHIAAGIGSWPFLIGQGFILAGWIAANGIWLAHRSWDPYPFILLNLCLSVQAAYAGPVILLAGNRQAKKDRDTLEHTFTDAETTLAEIKRNTDLTLAIHEHLLREPR